MRTATQIERSSPVQLGKATFTLRNNCLQPEQYRVVSVRWNQKNGDSHVMRWQTSALAKAPRRTLAAVVAVVSLVVLMDAGAKYSGLAWRVASLAREPAAVEQEVAAPGITPREFRLSANLPLERAPARCGSDAAWASPSGDEGFDNSCVGASTVKAVGELPSMELLSWPGDWLYHRTARF